MNKDVIYIDVEDDITAIIGKIKSSHEKIVALVPPKRVGVLQSAVNLRLLSRAATNANKHLVLVTNNKALMALSAASMIPVAKNLQSKPEIIEPEELEIDEKEDIIEGAEMPVGELAKTTSPTEPVEDVAAVITGLSIDGEKPIQTKEEKKMANTSSKIKVPDFSRFRKKIFIGAAAAVLLVAFFVWAIVFAPSAKIIVTTNTIPAPISATLKLGTVEATDVAKGIIQTVSKQIKKDVSVQFDATGQKDLGAKALGTVTVANCDSSSPITLAAGTTFVASSGQRFVNTKQEIIPGFSGSASACRDNGTGAGTVVIPVVASQPGESYNIPAENFSIVGVSGDVYSSGSLMTGGTTKIAAVVTAADIQKASQALVDLPTDDVKQQLIKQFTNGEIVIPDSFNIDRAAAVSTVAVDAEATGKAKLTSASTFTMLAISKSEMQLYLKGVLAKQVSANQRVYDDGSGNVKISGYIKTDQTSTINISTIGKIGPNIDSESIKNLAKGKRFGDVQSVVGNIQGVSNVDIKFPYFWINTVPSDVTKIDVEFILKNA